MPRRRSVTSPASRRTSVVAAIALATLGAGAAGGTPEAGYLTLLELAGRDPAARAAALRELARDGDRALVPGMVDALFFVPRAERGGLVRLLERLTGERGGERYLDWVDIVMRHPEWAARPGYPAWKAGLFARIDPCFGELLSSAPSRLRLEEVVFGGVRCEGIPALDRPSHGPTAAGGWLSDGELVFGAAVGGESRAYPVSVLSWHEMLNDELGGEPVTLSYCTLCGSAVLYSGRAGDRTLTFGTSGLLYRSNKLMVDRQTRTLWLNLTGEAVLGPLAARSVRLRRLPLTTTSWGAWRRAHPSTTVLAVDRVAGRALGYDYRPGAADERRRGVRFPTGSPDARLPGNEEVYGLRIGDSAKAYAIGALARSGVLHDLLGGVPIVLVADDDGGGVRAYASGEERFARADEGRLVDQRGQVWAVGEAGLTGPDGRTHERLPGTLAFWRGWVAFYPRSEVWTPATR